MILVLFRGDPLGWDSDLSQFFEDVPDWNPVLLPWAVSLPVHEIFQPALSPAGIEEGADCEGRLAVDFYGFGEHGSGRYWMLGGLR